VASAQPIARLRAITRAYPTLLRIGLAEAFAYRAEFVIWVLTTTLPLIMMALWAAAAREAPIGRFDQAGFRAYYLVTLIVRQMTGSWVVWELNMEIRQGRLPMRMLRPMHPLLGYSAESLAAIPLRAVLATPVAAIMLLSAGREHLTHDPITLAVFVVSLFGAWLVQFLMMAIIGSLGMFIESSVAVFEVWAGLFAVLSGYLVPLELFPRWVRELAHLLPFRYMLGFPVETLTGGLGRAQALAELATQAGYAAVLFALLVVTWRAGVRRYQAYGG
jgi:ABC-2 type transport system permease protein